MPAIKGGCLCGAVQYIHGRACTVRDGVHCATCQKNSGGAFSLNLAMPAGSVTITGDALTTYEDRAGASGKPFYRTFCSRCGSPISARGAAYEGLVFLKAGTLDDPSWLRPNAHIWCAEKQPWVPIEACAAQFPGNPG